VSRQEERPCNTRLDTRLDLDNHWIHTQIYHHPFSPIAIEDISSHFSDIEVARFPIE